MIVERPASRHLRDHLFSQDILTTCGDRGSPAEAHCQSHRNCVFVERAQE